MKSFFLLIICSGLLNIKFFRGPDSFVYKLPDSYKFDYAVTQTVRHENKLSDSSIIHFFYTKSGGYAGIEMSRNADKQGKFVHRSYPGREQHHL